MVKVGEFTETLKVENERLRMLVDLVFASGDEALIKEVQSIVEEHARIIEGLSTFVDTIPENGS